jgi:polysaccharide biosynthesis protein PslH
MRVLFLSTWFPYPPDNGSKLRVYYLLRALNGHHEVTLISFAFGSAVPQDGEALKAICQHSRVLGLDPFATNHAGTLATFLSTRPAASRPIPAMGQLVAEVWQRQTFEVVIASTEMTVPYALLGPPRVAKALEEHNSLTRWMAERCRERRGAILQARYWASWQKQRAHERRTYPRFDLVTMVSEEDRRATAEIARSRRPRLEVVPNGVDCEHNRPGLAQRRPKALVFNGALTYSSNYDAMQWFLAQVYPAIREQEPEVSLSITGSLQGVNRAGLALDATVMLTGCVPDLRLLVAEAAACIAPIRLGGGTRLKILEAMALGTPVVATRKGAEGLDVVDGEHLLLADDAMTFANCVVTLMRTPTLGARLSANARRLVEGCYDWKQIGGRFVALVEEVAAHHERAL